MTMTAMSTVVSRVGRDLVVVSGPDGAKVFTLESAELPNFTVPPFDGIGADEYIVDVTHKVPGPDGKDVPAVDFLSMVDTPSIWELNTAS